jgi:hypothetical protein
MVDIGYHLKRYWPIEPKIHDFVPSNRPTDKQIEFLLVYLILAKSNRPIAPATSPFELK